MNIEVKSNKGKEIINSFSDEYRFLSNFWPARVRLGRLDFPSVENAYQAAKTIKIKERRKFTCCTAVRAKRLGEALKIRSDWDAIKLPIMEKLVRQKFTYSLFLKNKLVNTGNAELIEGNWWNDTFWGVCRGKGANHLGKILMQVRASLSVIKNNEPGV